MVDRLIGTVETVDTDNWSITFNVNKLFGDDVSTKPRAVPLFGTTQEVCEGDPVCIFYNYEYKDAFYYTKITKENFVGLFNKKCGVDITDGENIIVGSGKEIQLNGDEDYLIMFNKLKNDLDQFVQKLNTALTKYSAKMTAAWASLTCTPPSVLIKSLQPDTSFDNLSIDINDAKAESLRTSGKAKPRDQ